MIKLAVIGSRSFKDYAMLKYTLSLWYGNSIALIVSGGAWGADSLAEKYASEHGIKTLIFLPDRKRFGRLACAIRNRDIILNCDQCVAFWDGISRGTKQSIDICVEEHKPVVIHYFTKGGRNGKI